MAADLTIRAAGPDDLDAIIAVGRAALGWNSGNADVALFRWKHFDNPFGASSIWLAEDDSGRLAGYRAFMRWDLSDASGRVFRCVRAVDTATHPDFQRQGIFSRLTKHALAQAESQGIDFVFNTPNDQSRPGYLKMGWIDVGRVPTQFRPTGIGSIARMRTARTAGGKWAEESTVGDLAIDALANLDLGAIVPEQPADGISTPWTGDALRWRYGLAELGYRVWQPTSGDGAVIFRIRRRGETRECGVGHVLTDAGDQPRLLRAFARIVDADHVLTLGPLRLSAGFLPAPGQGPRLTARTVTAAPPPDMGDWHFDLGDIELF